MIARGFACVPMIFGQHIGVGANLGIRQIDTTTGLLTLVPVIAAPLAPSTSISIFISGSYII
jgi:hypothetical protein